MLFRDVYGYGDIDRCPVNLITPQTQEVITVYNRCRNVTEYGWEPNGLMPATGGIMNQSKTLMEAFDILDRVINKVWAAARKAEAEKRKRRG